MARRTKCTFCGAQIKYKQTKCEYCGSEIIKQENILDKKIIIDKDFLIPSLSEKFSNFLKKSKSKINKTKINSKKIVKSIIIQPAYIAKELNIEIETIQKNPTYKKIGLGILTILASIILPLLIFEIYQLSTYKSLLKETKKLLENKDTIKAEKSIEKIIKTLNKTNFHRIPLKASGEKKNYLIDISDIYRGIARIELTNNNFRSNIFHLEKAQKFYNLSFGRYRLPINSSLKTDLIFAYYYLARELFDDGDYETAKDKAKKISDLLYKPYFRRSYWNNFVKTFPENINEFIADYNFLIGKSYSFLNNDESAVFYFAKAFRIKSNYTFENLNQYLLANQLKTIDDYCENNTINNPYFPSNYYQKSILEQSDYKVLCMKKSHYTDHYDESI